MRWSDLSKPKHNSLSLPRIDYELKPHSIHPFLVKPNRERANLMKPKEPYKNGGLWRPTPKKMKRPFKGLLGTWIAKLRK